MKRFLEDWEPWLGTAFLLLLVSAALLLGGEGLMHTIWTLLWLFLGLLLAIGLVVAVGALYLILHGGIPFPKRDLE